jgi:hypothetical protein
VSKISKKRRDAKGKKVKRIVQALEFAARNLDDQILPLEAA